jgi:hypothetical protein
LISIRHPLCQTARCHGRQAISGGFGVAKEPDELSAFLDKLNRLEKSVLSHRQSGG